MLKKIGMLISCMMLLIVSAGCSNASETTKSFTYSVDTGDVVTIVLDISDDYDITSDLPFIISHKGETESQGTFITAEAYRQYEDAVKSDQNAVFIENGNKDGNDYLFWSYNDSEYNYAILISGSDTGMILGNNVSESSARECFERMAITIEQ